MTLTDLSSLDGAELVVVEDSGFNELLAVWFGGTQFRVFATTNDADKPLDERTVFSVCDENGEPVSRERAEEHAREWLQDQIDH